MRVIVFSKDRAFQLGQYLRTLFAFRRGAELDVHVLYRVEPAPQQGSAARRDFATSYERVQAAFPSVHFCEADSARRPERPLGGRAGGCAVRHVGLGWRLLTVALCLLVLPVAQARQDAPTYKNVTRILRMLGDTWRGSGYDDNSDVHYLFRPRERTNPREDMTCA